MLWFAINFTKFGRNFAIYDTRAEAVADSYLQVGGNFLARCKEEVVSGAEIFANKK